MLFLQSRLCGVTLPARAEIAAERPNDHACGRGFKRAAKRARGRAGEWPSGWPGGRPAGQAGGSADKRAVKRLGGQMAKQ